MGTVARKVEKTNLVGMFLNPVFYLCCMMDRVTINNEKYLTSNLAYHAFEKYGEDITVEAGFENHKIKMFSIVDRRDHIAAKTLSGPRDYRRLATTSIGPTYRMIGSLPSRHLSKSEPLPF